MIDFCALGKLTSVDGQSEKSVARKNGITSSIFSPTWELPGYSQLRHPALATVRFTGRNDRISNPKGSIHVEVSI